MYAIDASDVGVFLTNLFTDVHEWHSDNDSLETLINQHNKVIGRETGGEL